MTDVPEQASEDRLSHAAMGIFGLLIGLLILFVVVFSVVVHRERCTPLIAIGTAWLILVFAGRGIASIGRWRRWSWADRLGSFITGITVAGIAAIVISGIIRDPRTHYRGLLAVLAVGWIGFGLFLYIITRRTDKSDDITSSPAIVIVWPFLLLLSGGLIGIVFLLAPFGALSAGYLIGHRVGHPYIGAIVAVLIPAAIIGLVSRKR